MTAVTMHHFSGLSAPFVRSKGTVSGGVFSWILGKAGVGPSGALPDSPSARNTPDYELSLIHICGIEALSFTDLDLRRLDYQTCGEVVKAFTK